MACNRPRTEDEKRRISESLKKRLAGDPALRRKRAPFGRILSLETRTKIAAAHMGMSHGPIARAKISLARTGKPLSAAHKLKISQFNRGRPASFPMKRFYYAGCAFRSSWELRVAKALDALGVRWLYESKRFDLKTQTYAPDFYLPDGDCYWEVKGYYGPKSKRTIALFREHHPNETLLVVDEDAMLALERAARQAA